MHLIRRHRWVGDHHTLHRSSWLVAHDTLTLGRLLHSHEALEPLLTRQDRLVTCKEKPPFEEVGPGKTQVVFGGDESICLQANPQISQSPCYPNAYFVWLLFFFLLQRGDKMAPNDWLIFPSLCRWSNEHVVAMVNFSWCKHRSPCWHQLTAINYIFLICLLLWSRWYLENSQIIKFFKLKLTHSLILSPFCTTSFHPQATKQHINFPCFLFSASSWTKPFTTLTDSTSISLDKRP